MGIIAKQSIRGSIYTYGGALIGFVNTGLLMPKFFSTEQVGLVNILIALTLMFSQFSTLGFASVNTRIFPYFRNKENKHNGIFSLGAIVTLSGVILSLIFIFVFKSEILQSNAEKSKLLEDNLFYLPVLIFFTAYFLFFDSYAKAVYDAVTGTFLRDFFVKISNLGIIILYIFDIISFDVFVFLYVLVFVIPAIIIVVILFLRKDFSFRFINLKLFKKYKREIFKVSVFGIISGFSGIAILNIDKYMVNAYLGLSAAGIYSIAFFFGMLVIIPAKSLRKISSIVLADAWKNNDIDIIKSIYKKSTINQMIIGAILSVGIIINLDNIFLIIPDYVSGRYVIIFIVIGYFFEMTSGVSSMVILSSKHYKIFSYMMLITLFNTVVFNIIFIPMFQITGAGIASASAIIIFLLMRYFFILKKFKLQPYSYKHILILLISGFVFLLNLLIPENKMYILDIIIRSSIVSVVFILLIYLSKVSDEANKYADKGFNYLKNKLRR
ncbi:MAG: polysaccharide biosynthesis C-terminal domain-containing protein [Bacteroidales bacterium]|nr:polysaccharide biosynthesis C-terminal domain-containing protein [Bacteroidales bacterium]